MAKLTRRRWLGGAGATAAVACSHKPLLANALSGPSQPDGTPTRRRIAAGPFQPTWESLSAYRTADWFRDAKFGIWAHWSAQCVPEQGDWYARKMYIQGDPIYEWHVKNYGHPSKFGFKEIDHLWKAERWQPDELMNLYKAAGAKYFMALACHHDNFDTFISTHHAWNATHIGPKRDIIAEWKKVATEHGLRLGVSNHASHAWHWFQTAYAYDAEGPLAGVRYDAFTLDKAQGSGTWWEGLDPQELYTGRNIVMPDGLNTIAAQNQWHATHDRIWNEAPPPDNPDFVNTWFLRCQELIDRYDPDLIYFDDDELPLGQAGLDATAHYYNSSIARHGSLQGVVFGKHLKPEHVHAVTLDIERSRSTEIRSEAWQTDTCIGDWHYKRSLFERHAYKKPETVIPMLIDVVSKNGNLLLSIPVRGDGTLDEDEHDFLRALASWLPQHGEGIYGTRPFTVYGEGPPEPIEANFSEKTRAHTAEDIRFTTRAGLVYAFVLAWPSDGVVRIKTLRQGSEHAPRPVRKVELIGASSPLKFQQTGEALVVTMPQGRPNPYAYGLRLSF